MLTLSGVTKSFGIRRVLDGVDLEVSRGDSLALLGANGSGKTTTLRCCVGLARADAGRIVVAGHDVSRDGREARRRLSYLPQKPSFPATLTVRETLAAVASFRGLGRTEVDREIETFRLTALADRSVRQLSGGERQRLSLAVTFLPRVDLYLFDEPSASLDPAASRLFFQRARQLRRDGRTLLFTTHIPADVHQLATRVALLRDGRIVSDAASAFELRRSERMLERDLWGDDDDDSQNDRGDRAGAAGDRVSCGSAIA